MLDFGFYNMDCMEGMKQFPDKYFDLALVDPPYGSGLADNGGCKGRFTKYHQDRSQIVNVERERGSITDSEAPAPGLSGTSVSRTSGRTDRKYGKKS